MDNAPHGLVKSQSHGDEGAGEYQYFADAGPNETITFATPVERLVVTGIDESLMIDPSNAIAFPVTLIVAPGTFFGGTVEAMWLKGDFNADGVVNAADLGLLLGNWGSDDPVIDVNDDGIVDAADLGVVLGQWTAVGR